MVCTDRLKSEIIRTNPCHLLVLSDFEPSISLSVSFPDAHETVHLGNDIPVSSVSSRPVIEFHPYNGPHLAATSRRSHPIQISKNPRHKHDAASADADVDDDPEDLVYTVALTDPDAKSRDNPVWSEMAHWIVTNLTLVPSPSTLPSEMAATELLPYLPPSPPPKTGSHRYVFVILSGTAEATAQLVPPKKSKEGRQHWGYDEERTGVERWAKESGLDIVGANFFFARNEKQ